MLSKQVKNDTSAGWGCGVVVVVVVVVVKLLLIKKQIFLMAHLSDGLHWTKTIFVGFNIYITKNGTHQKNLRKIN